MSTETKAANPDYLVGLGDFLMDGESIGLVEKNSFKLNPQDAQYMKLFAEQKTQGPVFVMVTENGSIEPTFNIIKINYETLQKVKGGTLVKDDNNKIIGWLPPKGLDAIYGKFAIKFFTGRYLPIPNALLLANFGDSVTLTEATKLKCKLVPFTDETASLYGLQDAAPTAENPIITEPTNSGATETSNTSQGQVAADPDDSDPVA